MKYANDLKDKTFYIFAFKAAWPDFLEGTTYRTHLEKRGAKLVTKFDKNTDYVVIGGKRIKGRADKIRQAKKEGIHLLHEFTFFEVVRLDLKDVKFAFTGGFHLGISGLESGPASILKNIKAKVSEIEDAKYFVIGDKRGKGKAAAIKKATALEAKGALKIMDEESYINFISKNCNYSRLDFPSLILLLRTVANPRKVDRAIQMLKTASYNIYADVSDKKVAGIVNSQSGGGYYYAPWIKKNGQYSCCDEDLDACMGLQGSICKHTLVLLLGLAKKGEIELQQAFDWAAAAMNKSPVENEDESATMILRYKGVKTGEVDWRPTETMPEDFYIF